MNSIRPLLLSLLIAAGTCADAGPLRRADANDYLDLATADLLEERVYIVQMAEPAAVSYRGELPQYSRTRPVGGERFDAGSSEVRSYARHLTESHDEVLQSVGAWHGKLYSYRYAFNGFAARMTAAQAYKLGNRKNVLRVWEDKVRYLQTNDSPAFLGLLDQKGGLRIDRKLRGEDVVIGVIDSGITPDHPSFEDSREADRPNLCKSEWSESSLLGLWLCARFRARDDVLLYEPLADWSGVCEAGESFDANACNNKLIGARFYIDGFLESYALDANEFISPLDADGHGTHIASTAAGNDVRASIAGSTIARISGIAPRARIATYKACWLEPGQIRGSCSTSDLQRAIEDAVADGVDIINYSVGNTDISIADPDDLALLAASDAGVLSVVAGGNDGPDPLGNILSPSGAPWVLTVAASSRTGEKFEEALEVTAPEALSARYVTREAAFTPPLRDNGPVAEEVILVEDGSGVTFDGCEDIENSATLTGRIAFLQRGGCDFEIKLANAEAAGAVAAIVFDNQGEPIIMAGTRGSVNIPAVMIGQADGQLIFDRLENGERVDITLDKNLLLTLPDSGDVMGSFSSTGPNLTAADILKPDITAPGVDILAGHSPQVANGIRGEQFQYLSGTSMSVPHVAGIAALIREAHPDWSPAAIKSALMTTARQDVFKQDGETPADPFDFGSGHVVPNNAVDPGLVYDAGKADYDAFACGAEFARVSQPDCDALAASGFATEASQLNLPSIAVASLVSERRIRRRVTNVGPATQYEATLDPPPGFDMSVTPALLSIGSGETAEYEVRLSADGAAPFAWQFGALSWSDGEHVVRSPVAVRSVPFQAPLEARGDGIAGTLTFPVEFGYTGDYVARPHGLVPADVDSGTVQNDPGNNYVFEPDTALLPPSVNRFRIDVGADQVYLRVALFDRDTDGDDDLDLYVYRCPGLILCESAGFSGRFDSNEQVDILFPLSGEYFIDVHGFNTDDVSGGPGANYDLSVWVIGADDLRGNLSVQAPAAASGGVRADITATWAGLDASRYLGGITHSEGPGLITDFDDPRFLEFTLLEINY